MKTMAIPEEHEDKTIENFEERPSNSIVDARDMVEQRLNQLHETNDIDSLVLLGDIGTGKTHLMASIYHGITAYNDQIRGEGSDYYPRPSEWYNFTDFIKSVKESYDERNKNPMKRAKKTTYLFFDDVGNESPTDHNASLFYQIIDYKYRNHEPVFLTSNRSADQFINRYGQAVMSRLHSMGEILHLTGPDYRENQR